MATRTFCHMIGGKALLFLQYLSSGHSLLVLFIILRSGQTFQFEVELAICHRI